MKHFKDLIIFFLLFLCTIFIYNFLNKNGLYRMNPSDICENSFIWNMKHLSSHLKTQNYISTYVLIIL